MSQETAAPQPPSYEQQYAAWHKALCDLLNAGVHSGIKPRDILISLDTMHLEFFCVEREKHKPKVMPASQLPRIRN